MQKYSIKHINSSNYAKFTFSEPPRPKNKMADIKAVFKMTVCLLLLVCQKTCEDGGTRYSLKIKKKGMKHHNFTFLTCQDVTV